MAAPNYGSTLEGAPGGLPLVSLQGLNTNKAVNFSGFLVDTSGNVTNPGTESVAGLFTATGGFTVPTGKTGVITDSAGLTVGGVIVPQYEYVTSPTFAAAGFVNGTAYPIYTFPNDGTTWKLVFASLRATTAGGASSTCTVYLDPSGTAPGAGTAQFAAMAIDGTANTVVNAATPVSTTSAAGAAISLKAGGAATTGLVGLVVTVALQRLT
jgi:hypothetical protein